MSQNNVKALHSNNFIPPILYELKNTGLTNTSVIKKYDDFMLLKYFPSDINNNGVVVGTGEIEPSLSSSRRRVGFVYDTAAENAEFINLNDAIACDSPYFIVDARAITDSGEVVASALKTEEYVDGEGNTQTRQVSVTIKMDPIEGELNNCREEENKA